MLRKPETRPMEIDPPRSSGEPRTITVVPSRGRAVAGFNGASLFRTDDLAVVHVRERLAPLKPATARPRLGTTVMVLGSPLGLGGSLSIGLVSGFRSIDGSDYVQFSAPISPGNSGGPVVDSQGHVIGIASGKYVGDGVEALGFAIPVSVACAQLNVCEET